MVPRLNFRFVVVGTGRSGTGYAARLFTELDIPCGHEAAFDPDVSGRPLLGDASFGIVPFLEGFGGLVFHQVRHPLAVLRSMLATDFFSSPGRYAPYYRLLQSTLPRLDDRGTPVRKAMYYIVAWNRRCERAATLRWRVESLDAATLRRASALVGCERSVQACAAALERVPRDVNRLELRGLERADLAWADLPDCPEKRDLVDSLRRYGYGRPDGVAAA
jgi:hypothetical protein